MNFCRACLLIDSCTAGPIKAAFPTCSGIDTKFVYQVPTFDIWMSIATLFAATASVLQLQNISAGRFHHATEVFPHPSLSNKGDGRQAGGCARYATVLPAFIFPLYCPLVVQSYRS